MSIQDKSAKINFEINCIKNDASFYLELILKIIKEKSADIFIFGFLPYLALFTVETYEYIQKNFPKYAKNFPKNYHQIIRTSRMRIKLFDDTSNQVTGSFELLDWISTFHKEWHINSHKGSLASLKRALQPDLGIFAYDGHIIGSTHTGLLLTGLVEKDISQSSENISERLGTILRSVGEELGIHLAMLNGCPDFTSSMTNNFQYALQGEQFGYKDVKSEQFFSLIFNGSDTKLVNFSLFWFLSIANFIRYILTKLIVGLPDTLFKLKFITLYHLISSLQRLQNYCYPKKILTEYSQEHFRNILHDKNLKKFHV